MSASYRPKTLLIPATSNKKTHIQKNNSNISILNLTSNHKLIEISFTPSLTYLSQLTPAFTPLSQANFSTNHP
ncbi:MAG: hypothetical protein J6571_01895 [Snodgrassella sp.]|uniref:hypothetical protein n=1 Tax=Snodgrassella sp. TaxID=2815304 RepID=UPI002583D415|nr:hypothetical protein [Snodgrassella sp.]MCO6521932.1 hypothetical protein [Snodgrassella sp.]